MSYLYSKLPETGVSPHIGTGAARVEQKDGTYLNNIQRDRQSSPSLPIGQPQRGGQQTHYTSFTRILTTIHRGSPSRIVRMKTLTLHPR